MAWLNVIGLVFDLVGALVLASGLLLNPFEQSVSREKAGPPVLKTPEMHRQTVSGLLLLSLGFIMQIIAAAVPLMCC